VWEELSDWDNHAPNSPPRHGGLGGGGDGGGGLGGAYGGGGSFSHLSEFGLGGGGRGPPLGVDLGIDAGASVDMQVMCVSREISFLDH